MTLCLALDTVTKFASVAVGKDDEVVVEVTLGGRRAASELMPAIEHCLDLAGITFEDLDDIAVADGPGSFTGLRIGLATVQGIVTEREIPVSVTPSLMVTAWGVATGNDKPAAALYDALRGEVFAAVYSFSSEAVTVHHAPSLTTLETLRANCPATPTIAAGDGAAAYPTAVREWTGCPPVGPPRGAPRASLLLMVRRLKGGSDLLDSLSEFEPTYGRQAEAQARWEREHGRPLPHSPG